jgi:hypothetical protein
MGVLEQIARSKGWSGALDNQIWNSFKNKNINEVLPHAQQILKENGKLGAVMNFFGGSKN